MNVNVPRIYRRETLFLVHSRLLSPNGFGDSVASTFPPARRGTERNVHSYIRLHVRRVKIVPVVACMVRSQGVEEVEGWYSSYK